MTPAPPPPTSKAFRNWDQDIIGETQRRLGVHIDAVVTAEHVGSYKPDHGHFVAFERSFGATRENWVHIAQSHFHDMAPAHALNIPRIWINRRGGSEDPSVADAVLPDLTGLVPVAEAVNRAARSASG